MVHMANLDLDTNCTKLWTQTRTPPAPSTITASVTRIFKALFLTHACSSFGWCKHTVITLAHERAARAIRNTFKMPQQWSDKIKQTLEHHAIRCELVYTTKGQGHVFSESVLNHKTECPPSHAWARWRNLREEGSQHCTASLCQNLTETSLWVVQRHWSSFLGMVCPREIHKRKQVGYYKMAFHDNCAFLVSNLLLQCIKWGKLLTNRKYLSHKFSLIVFHT